MGNVIIYPSILNGQIIIPPSKSICHRAIICGGLSDGVSNIKNVVYSEDIEATCSALRSLGVSVEAVIVGNDTTLRIKGVPQIKETLTNIDCIESGSTLRFMIPIALALGIKTTFRGKGNLVERPLKPYYDIFNEQQINYDTTAGKLPLTIDGKLKFGEFKIEGNVSSQFISGLLFALPLLKGDSKIILISELESKPYVDLTIEMLKNFSVVIENSNYKEFTVKGNQTYTCANYNVEGDFSQAAFWLGADVLGSDVTCLGLNINSIQGDKIILKIIESMGAGLSIKGEEFKAFPSITKDSIIDASQCPDLVPVLAVIAALSVSTTKIINCGRLRFKECDRLAAIRRELNKIGADIEEEENALIIKGKANLRGGMVNSWNDHRIAMALAIASIKCKEPLIIMGSDCVKKSYPHFWDEFKKLGGKIDEWNLGE